MDNGNKEARSGDGMGGKGKSAEKLRNAKPWKIRVALFFKVNLFILSLLIMAACIAGVKVGQYFYDTSGMTVMECYKNGKETVKGSKPADFKSDKATNIYAASGKKISTVYKNRENTYLAYDEIPQFAIDAFVAVEDRTFWENDGVDLKGIARVVLDYIRTGGRQAHGASTITQQLARQKYLTLDRTLSRKVAEIAVSRELTKKYSKEDIMEFYVNTCCFANGIYGIQDAAFTYFGKDVSGLSLSQVAYLCAIPNWPEHYDPFKDANAAISRRDKILGDMLEMGYISQTQHDKAVNEEIRLYKSDKKERYYDYETTYAIHCATEYMMGRSGFEFRHEYESDADYNKYQREYQEAYAKAKDGLYGGGYDIYTTIDLKAQRKMQKAVDSALMADRQKLKNGVYRLQGAMTAIDNETGKVIAVVGGRKQKGEGEMFTLNRAYQGYAQPGSSIKPLVVYTPAMEGKEDPFTPDSVLRNIDVSYAKKSTRKEISKMDGTEVLLRNAVRDSLNGCAYWLLNDIGVKRGVSHLADMGFSRVCPSDYTLSAALGGLTYGTTTEEMANAYYTLANGGLYRKADCIKSILDRDGNEIYGKGKQARVYERHAADTMTYVMMDVVRDGTAKGAGWYSSSDTDAAGKTGTTNDNKAAWFCGYTPYYTVSVWVGYDRPASVPGLTGSSYPLSIWKDAMLALIDGKPDAHFPELHEEEQEEIKYCICSGKCHGGSINEACPVCSGASPEDAYYVCDGVERIYCSCEYQCEGDEINEACPVCVRNKDYCEGIPEIELLCICGSKCTKKGRDGACPACQNDWKACEGEEFTCTCKWSCGQDGLNAECGACMEDSGNCMGKRHKEPEATPEPIIEEEPKPSEEPEETAPPEGEITATDAPPEETEGIQ